MQWLDQAIPLHVNGQPAGALVVLEDASYIRSEANAVWRQSFWRIAALVLLIVGVTFLMVALVPDAARLPGLRSGCAGCGWAMKMMGAGTIRQT